MITDSFIPETANGSHNFEQTTVNGVSYTNALLMEPYGGSTGVVQIAAERRFKRFMGQLGIPDNQHADQTYMVTISLDGSAPVLSTVVRFGTTTPINLDVSNALRIVISSTNISDCCGYLAIGNPTLS